MAVELIYPALDRLRRFEVAFRPGMTAAELVTSSRILKECPELGGSEMLLGIFGRRCEPNTPLRDGDRVEIYRPLVNDPKKARRERASKVKTRKLAG